MASASLEIIAAIVRVHEAGGTFGHPFSLTLVVSGDEGVATIKALNQPIAARHVRPIGEALLAAGFHTARWTRRRAGRLPHEVRVDLSIYETGGR